MKLEPDSTKRIWALFAGWTLVVVLFGGFSIMSDYRALKGRAEVIGKVAFDKDVAFRLWNAQTGGVYVRVDEGHPPNPYLDVPGRDIMTESGEMLTMINPAYMTRQVHELQAERAGVRGHITSLDPIRPENAPDEWERQALKTFENGDEVASSYEKVQGVFYLRYMRPMIVEEACLKCHAQQGYKIGDVRGGISVAVPMTDLWDEFIVHSGVLVGGHLFIWAAGCLGLAAYGRSTRRSFRILREASEAAQASSRSKSAFLANMSHEIRTPLNGVVGMMQLLETTELEEEQQEYVEGALQASKRLNRLLSDILDLSRVEAGRMNVIRRPFQLRTIFEELEVLFRRAVQESDIELVITCDERIPDWMQGDGQRLAQILFNLVGNAVKFTESGTVKVSADMMAAPGPGLGRVLFTVTDTGIGMDAEVLSRVFEPFAQAERSYRRQFQGAGLGLSIVLRLTELLDGEINVQSEPGEGTSFFLSLPFGLMDEAAASAPSAPVEQSEFSLQGRWALVVEDDRTSRIMLMRFLERLGLQVDAVVNGQQALAQIVRREYDVVFMDAQMPVMDGVEATRAIRTSPEYAKQAAIPIVAMTAFVQRADRERMIDAGMDDYVAKPLDMEALPRVLARVLRKSSSARED